MRIGQGPKIVAVIWGDRLLELARAAKEGGAQVLEVRADLFEKVNLADLKKRLKEIKRKVKLPIIATVRRRDEGGGRRYTERQRLHIFRSLMPMVDAVDIELRSGKIIGEVMREAKRRRRLVLVSYHNLEKTPPNSILKDIACRAKQIGADMVKIATLAKNRQDVARLLSFTYQCPHKPLVTISLGRVGSISRIIAPLFGSRLTYGCVEAPAAPGQLDVLHLKEKLEKICVT
ncbi:type I 3-dehydroquinate dehydratase [candidate division NPL-UPA2 bacterium]|nr:type I 3-dehydroquinate dehydratase [candidate division NPL-UPA2 bacterium]